MSAPEHGFARPHRLSAPADFSAVFKSTKRISDVNFVILYRPNGLRVARLGMAISKKNIRLATARNKIKRTIRECFRHRKVFMKGFDVLVIAKKNLNIKNQSMMAASLSKLWQNIKSA